MMLKRLLPLALIAVTLAMPPTADAEITKFNNGFIDQTRAAPADYTLEVYARQLDFPSFILTSNPALPDLIMVGTANTRAYNASRLAATMVVVDQEVSPSGDLAVMITSSTRLNTRNKNQTTAINARSTVQYPAMTTNDDKTITLVDYGIVNRR